MIEKGLTSCDPSRCHKKQTKTGRKSKSNAKTGLKENERTVKEVINSVNESSSPAIDESQRRYGLRKLAPINWRERLDTRYLINESKSDKIKDKYCDKSEKEVNVSKNSKEKRFNVNNRLNGKINANKKYTKLNSKCNKSEVDIEKRITKRKNGRGIGHIVEQRSEAIEESHTHEDIDSIDEGLNMLGEAVVSSEHSAAINVINPNPSEASDRREDRETCDSLDNISYFEFLKRSMNNQSVPSFSYRTEIIMRLLLKKSKAKSKSKTKAQLISGSIEKPTIRSNNRKKLYSCGYDLCDSKWCHNSGQQ